MKTVDVCAAVIMRRGKVLLATRPKGAHLAGKWEFPGGKVHGQESLGECIRREIAEELGVNVEDSGFLCTVAYQYPEKAIRLHFLWCKLPAHSAPTPHEGQTLGWFAPEALEHADLAPADKVFLTRLRQTDGLRILAAHGEQDAAAASELAGLFSRSCTV